jgi:hypothetical protein
MALLLLLSHAAAAPYSPAFSGRVEGFRLAGIEPDGDPLNQVVLSTTLTPSTGMPRLHLIVNSYLENFKPDTTPILPDLLHPNRTATNLGGFLNGKALITDDAGNLLYVGDFLAEAFLNNSNHTVMRLVGVKAAQGGSARLKGVFSLKKNGALAGNLTGRLTLPPPARAQISRNNGTTMKSVEKIIGLVTVKPHAMMGRSTHSSSAPLHTGYGKTAPSTGPAPATSPHATPSNARLSPVTMVAGAGAIACLLAAIVLWVRQRRTGGTVPEQAE